MPSEKAKKYSAVKKISGWRAVARSGKGQLPPDKRFAFSVEHTAYG